MSEELRFNAWVEEEFRRMFDLEWSKAVSESLKTPSHWKGFRGWAALIDEWTTPENILTFTPAEFTEFWESLSRYEKIEYVKSLIT